MGHTLSDEEAGCLVGSKKKEADVQPYDVLATSHISVCGWAVWSSWVLRQRGSEGRLRPVQSRRMSISLTNTFTPLKWFCLDKLICTGQLVLACKPAQDLIGLLPGKTESRLKNAWWWEDSISRISVS